MKSMFEQTVSEEIISRLQKLTSSSRARWGKMNVSQMLAHCQVPIKVYFDDVKMKRGLIGILFGGLAKKKLFSEKPWKQGLPTSPEFVVRDERNFEEEKTKLLHLIRQFRPENKKMRSSVHPFFGKMSADEWGILAYKHLDHHLTQFGA